MHRNFALRKLSCGFNVPQSLQESHGNEGSNDIQSWIFGQDYKIDVKGNL